DCSRPYGHATMQTCSRKNAKSNIIKNVVSAITRNGSGRENGEPLIHLNRSSVPTKYAINVLAKRNETSRYVTSLAGLRHAPVFLFRPGAPSKNRSIGRYTNSRYTVCGQPHPHHTRPKRAVRKKIDR